MKLTKTQLECLSKLSCGSWHNAQSSKLHLGALNALSLKKLVEAMHSTSLMWRITPAGRAAINTKGEE